VQVKVKEGENGAPELAYVLTPAAPKLDKKGAKGKGRGKTKAASEPTSETSAEPGEDSGE